MASPAKQPVFRLAAQLSSCSFGPSRFSPSPEALPVHHIEGNRVSELRRQIRESCPKLPGVYGMLSAMGDLVYVGKAKSLRCRLLSYFRRNSRGPKAGKILQQARAILWEPAGSEFAALLRELELIQRWRPRFNVQGLPRRRRLAYLCLGRKPAPYAFVTARPARGVLACFGPLPAGGRLRQAVERLNNLFQLRDCPHRQEMIFADQHELFPVLRSPGCIRHEIGSCLAPCAAVCTVAAYQRAVSAARAFLDGRDRVVLETLVEAMNAAATSLQFERASVLRDRLHDLRWLARCLDRLHQIRRELTFIYRVPGSDGSEHWYLIRRGIVHGVLAAPSDDAGARTEARRRIGAAFDPNQSWSEPSVHDELDGVYLVESWFRRHPDERARVLTPAEALARLDDVADTEYPIPAPHAASKIETNSCTLSLLHPHANR